MDDLLFGGPNYRRLGAERVFKERLNPLEYLNDDQLHYYYRFTRRGIEFLLELLGPVLEPKTERSHAIPAVVQIFVALHYLSTGSFQKCVSKDSDLNISQSSVSRIVKKFCEEICKLKNHFIKFPTTAAAIQTQQNGFYRVAGLPNVIGCVDGTHIQIISPSQRDHEEVYVNRNNYHSINVQLICDSNYRIINVIAKWPGSVHDSVVFNMSDLPAYFERVLPGQPPNKGLLLGDGGYPCKNYLLTPYRNPVGHQQMKFNSSHKKTRSMVEMTIGQLKRRWAILHGEVRLHHSRAASVIMACCILHNIAKDLNMPDFFGPDLPNATEDFNGQQDTAMREHLTSLMH